LETTPNGHGDGKTLAGHKKVTFHDIDTSGNINDIHKRQGKNNDTDDTENDNSLVEEARQNTTEM
jgi:hypothetical protein